MRILDSSFGCTSDIYTRAYSPLLDEIVHRWMTIVGCLPHDFDITSHIGAYSPLHDEIVFGQRYIKESSLSVVYLTTMTSDIVLQLIPPSLVRFCLRNGMRIDY